MALLPYVRFGVGIFDMRDFKRRRVANKCNDVETISLVFLEMTIQVSMTCGNEVMLLFLSQPLP